MLASKWSTEIVKYGGQPSLRLYVAPVCLRAQFFGTHELYNDPYLRESGMFVTIDHPKRGRVVMPGWAVRMSDSPTQVRSAPLLGEHTEVVLSEWLGLSRQEIQQFRQVAAVAAS